MPGQFLGVAPTQPTPMTEALQALQPAVDMYSHHLMTAPEREIRRQEQERLDEQLALQQERLGLQQEQFQHGVAMDERQQDIYEEERQRQWADQFMGFAQQFGPDEADQVFQQLDPEQKEVLGNFYPGAIVTTETGEQGLALAPDWVDIEISPGLLIRQDRIDPDRRQVIDIRDELTELGIDPVRDVVSETFDPTTGNVHIVTSAIDPISQEITYDTEIIENVAPRQPDAVDFEYTADSEGNVVSQTVVSQYGDQIERETIEEYAPGDPLPADALAFQENLKVRKLESRRLTNELLKQETTLEHLDEKLEMELKTLELNLEHAGLELDTLREELAKPNTRMVFNYTGDPGDPVQIDVVDDDTGEYIRTLAGIPLEHLGSVTQAMMLEEQRQEVSELAGWTPEQLGAQLSERFYSEMPEFMDRSEVWWGSISPTVKMYASETGQDYGAVMHQVIDTLEETGLAGYPRVVSDLRQYAQVGQAVPGGEDLEGSELGLAGDLSTGISEILMHGFGIPQENIDEAIEGLSEYVEETGRPVGPLGILDTVYRGLTGAGSPQVTPPEFVPDMPEITSPMPGVEQVIRDTVGNIAKRFQEDGEVDVRDQIKESFERRQEQLRREFTEPEEGLELDVDHIAPMLGITPEELSTLEREMTPEQAEDLRQLTEDPERTAEFTPRLLPEPLEVVPEHRADLDTLRERIRAGERIDWREYIPGIPSRGTREEEPLSMSPDTGQESNILARLLQMLGPQQAEALEPGTAQTIRQPGVRGATPEGATQLAQQIVSPTVRQMRDPRLVQAQMGGMPSPQQAPPMGAGVSPGTGDPRQLGALAEALRLTGQGAAQPGVAEQAGTGVAPQPPRPTHMQLTEEEQSADIDLARELFHRGASVIEDLGPEQRPAAWYPTMYELGADLGLSPDRVERAFKAFTQVLGPMITENLFGKSIDEVWQLFEQYNPTH